MTCRTDQRQWYHNETNYFQVTVTRNIWCATDAYHLPDTKYDTTTKLFCCVHDKTAEKFCKAFFLYWKHSDIIFTHSCQPSPAWQVSLVTQCVSYLIPRVLAFTYFRSFQIPPSETLISPLLHFILLSVLHLCLSRSQRSVSLFFMAHWSLKSIWSHCPPVWDLENLRGQSASLTLLLLTWVRGGGNTYSFP